MNFPIGHLAWTRIENNGISIFDRNIKTFKSFLIIGAKDNIRVLLIPSDLKDNGLLYKNSEHCIEQFNILDGYADERIAIINTYHLSYLGGVCKECQSQFDHLSECDNFKCWKCDLSNL